MSDTSLLSVLNYDKYGTEPFRRGMHDFDNGVVEFTYSIMRDQVQYERGRQFAVICKLLNALRTRDNYYRLRLHRDII